MWRAGNDLEMFNERQWEGCIKVKAEVEFGEGYDEFKSLLSK
jgi:hypothetical protein